MIQLALDRLTREQCFQVTKQVAPYVDYIEVGTGVIKEYGMDILRTMKERHPDHVLVADMKTCDAGEHETRQALESGADRTTVMGFSADQTIADSLQVARSLNKKVVVDLLGMTSEHQWARLKAIGVEHVSVHIGKDMQQNQTLDTLAPYLPLSESFQVVAAGGIDPIRIKRFSQLHPAVYIVGNYITGASRPAAAAKSMQEVIQSIETNSPTNSG